MTGRIVDIKRFAVHDGPGIRTTVFLKGCTLACVWCHNPESISFAPELGYIEKKCIHCGECVSVCPDHAHTLIDGRHSFQRQLCKACGRCAEVCLGEALQYYGRAMTAEQVLALVLEDKEFYEASGGGLTLSGGEPLGQADFCAELLALAKQASIATAVDTSGAVPWSAFEKVLPVTDMMLFDIKLMNPLLHKEHTGSGNNLILENLSKLAGYGVPVEIRIPLVPGINDTDIFIDETGRFLRRLPNITAVKVLPYHAFARSKYAALAKPDTMPQADSPTDETLHRVARRLQQFGLHALSGKD